MRKLVLSVLLGSSFLGSGALAAVQNRIAGPVSDANRALLVNTVPARARLATDTGTLAPGTAIENMTLRFALTAGQQSALDQLLADQQNPASPRYHQWLTPEQFAIQFGLSAADQAKVSSWLIGKGFTVTGNSRGGTFLMFSGSAAQVASAFGTELHTLSESGQAHFSNVADPTLPAAIANVTAGITGLNDFRLRARARLRTITKPEFTSSTTQAHYLAPGDFYTIYDTTPLLNANINGAGQTIAVVGQVDISLADVAAFRGASGLAANVPVIKVYGTDPGNPTSATSTPSTGDLTEAQLDVEWSGAAAPGATILYVNSQDVVSGSLTQAIDNNVAPIITISYGDCESGFTSTNIAAFQPLLQQANVQGQTVVGPSGDSGATDCDNNVQSATHGLAVDFPASSPNVTGVGGTQFSGDVTGNYWNTTNGAYSGSAISYIPEVPWNETAADIAANPTLAVLSAGGGGSSAYFLKPAYQTGTGVPADGSRDVPDVALSAAGHDGYLICSQGACANGYRNTNGTLDVVAGTSASTPSFAGILALLEQKIGTRVGNANPTIYALANSNFYSAVFHDVTSGTNASPCTLGTINCPSGGSIGYSATTGYDRASGWGSVDANNFVNDWTLVSPAISSGVPAGTIASFTTLTTPVTTVNAGTAVPLTVTVVSAVPSSTATPTGTVQFFVDGTAAGNAVALASGGTATASLSTSTLAAGTHTLTVTYFGDSVYASSKASTLLNTVGVVITGDFSLTPATSAVAVASGGTAAGITFTVSPLNGFTGPVSFTASSTTSLQNATYSFSVSPVTLAGTTSGTTVLTLFAHQDRSSTGKSRLSPGFAHNAQSPSLSPWFAGSAVTFAGLLLIAMPRRRRWSGLLLTIVSTGLLLSAGCSSTGSTAAPASTTNATPGTYTVVVTATGTAASGVLISHNAQVTFTVQ